MFNKFIILVFSQFKGPGIIKIALIISRLKNTKGTDLTYICHMNDKLCLFF